MRASRRTRRGAVRRAVRDLGLIALALGAAAAPALAVDLLSGPTGAGVGLGAVTAAGIGAGLAVLCLTPQGEARGGGGALTAIAVGWLLAAAMAAVPFWAAARLDPAPNGTLAAFARPMVALFEGMSGVTGTGLSVAADPSSLPSSLQLWRSTTQWVGGIGWMLAALMLLGPLQGLPGRGGPGRDDMSSYRRHLPQLGAERTTDALAEMTRDPVTAIWAIYAILTFASLAALGAAGMPAWEAVNHALTGISTGGFAVTSDSFASYDAPILWTTMAIMTAGSLSFAAHLAWLTLRPLDRGERRQIFWFAGCLAFAVAVASFAARDEGIAFREVAFAATSALATCGFVAGPLDAWPVAGSLTLGAAMFVGACSGSTGGGLKMRRLATITEGLGHRIASARRAGETDEDTGDATEVEWKRLHDAAARLCFLAFAVWVGVVAMLLFTPGTDAPLEDIALDAVAALSTAGLSSGFVGPDLPGATLATFTALMWLGRLEVLAVLVAVLTAVPARRGRAP